ncbi:MAG: ABC transporter substrate-binding protein [Candidatus Sericytochromatia bacterium]|nr:ABC transporter substrate-binding protein [Candidatus Sericytochromatia bacterium]
MVRRNRLWGSAWLIGLTVLSVIAGCQRRQPVGSVYRWGYNGDIPSLDPIQINDVQSHDAGHLIYNALVTYRTVLARPGETYYDVIPDLAERWDISPDRRQYTFHLRPGVRFHHGRELEAADVKATFERLANPKNASKGLWTLGALTVSGLKTFQAACKAGQPADLAGVQVLDRFTLRLRLDSPIPFALHLLAMPSYYVAPPELTAKWGLDFSRHAVGTGPYRLAEWRRGQTLILEKNPHYWEKGLPHIGRVEIQVVPSDESRFLKFEVGDLEHNEPIPPGQFNRVLHDPRWNPIGAEAIRALPQVNDVTKSRIIKANEPTTNYLGFNMTLAPFTDGRVRQAFNWAVNKNKVCNRVWGGRAVPAVGVLPPGFPGFDPKRPLAYPYDPAKAKVLLDEAGWQMGPDGMRRKDGKPLKVTLWYNQDELWAATASAVQADLKQVGVDCELQAQLWQPYLEKIRKYEAPFFRFGWHADYPDPDNFLSTIFSKANWGQDNTSKYDNPQVEQWLAQAKVAATWPEREALYRQAESQIIRDAPWLFLLHRVQYKIVQPYVRHQFIHPIIQNDIKHVTLDAMAESP